MEDKNILEVKLEYTAKSFLDQIKGEDIQVVSHFDTDGITAATIMIQALKRLDQRFSLKIVKSLTKEFINSLDKSKVTLFLDLASGSLNHIGDAQLRKAYIIDHHEVDEEIPSNVEIVNPQLCEKQKISGSGLAYLFAKQLNPKNADLAKLAVLGMIGDRMEDGIEALEQNIIDGVDVKKNRGLQVYPSTRPLNRVLEYSSDPFIPGVTGELKGVLELLREAGINPSGGKYPSLIELTEAEMDRLVTAVVLRNPEKKDNQLLGDLYLIKLFGRFEDARETSAKINACSRDGQSQVAIGMCLENMESKKKADSIHVKYRQHLISGLKFAQESEKIMGPGYVIINAGDEIKDTMIGTISSIVAGSALHEEGTLIMGIAKDEENQVMKVSARIAGKKGKNVRELLSRIMLDFEGEVGGHEFAAGCSIPLDKTGEFIKKVKDSFAMSPTPEAQ